MDVVKLFRSYNGSKQSLGGINHPFVGKDGAVELFMAKTLELPWVNNQSSVSCIPTGIYLCRWTRSNRLSNASLNKWLEKNSGKSVADCPREVANIYTYEVLNVPGRSGIRIHSANFFSQLLGCIAFGDALKDINNDNQLDVIHSGNTVAKFAELMEYKDFYLDIRNAA